MERGESPRGLKSGVLTDNNHSTPSTTIRKTYKYRAYPTSKGTIARLERTLDLCRNLYNCALE
ncbi:MAG: helix-turn-helix domain-containing protein, partial [Candidatus Bipolaricaulia bacterium]